MHNNTSFPFLHLLFIIYSSGTKFLFCAGNFVPLNCMGGVSLEKLVGQKFIG